MKHDRANYVQQVAYFDNLTGLPNKSLLKERMRLAILDALKIGSSLAVLFINLDNMKTVNELLGHAVGDEMLKICAQRILSCSQEGDITTRHNGDAFILMLTNLVSGQYAKIAAASAAEQILATLSHPIMLYPHEITITPSIGIAIYPTDADNVMDIIMRADAAMHHVKSTGTSNYKFFSPFMNLASLHRFKMDSLLRQAINRMEFMLNYQPQVDNSGMFIGVEALLRWHSPALGNVSPTEFIPLAEENGAIILMGEWVFRAACSQRRYWLDKGLCADSFYIAVNVSPCQLRSHDFVEKITAIVYDAGILPHQINIELTEGALIKNPEDVKQKLTNLKAHGFRISVDDFGTGYSSLSYLKHFPIDVLKVDRSFVKDIGASLNDEVICRTIISLAGGLGIKTVAEGVETVAQFQFLSLHGCDAYQGYYFSEPVTALKISSLLQG